MTGRFLFIATAIAPRAISAFGLALLVSGQMILLTACIPPDEPGQSSQREAGFLSLTPEAPAAEPLPGLFLTWQRDPTSTMTIQWLEEAQAKPAERIIALRKQEHSTAAGWAELESTVTAIRGWPGMYLHRAELTGLTPDTAYRFRIEGSPAELGFRTMPATLERPLRFTVSGDLRNHSQEAFEGVNRAAVRHRPDFVVYGGDLAYANARPDRVYRWLEWFAAIGNTLIDNEGFVTPAVVGIGNHEVLAGYYYGHLGYEQTDAWRQRLAPFFYQLFAFPGQPGYGVLDFGDYLSLVILDSEHSNPAGGMQAAWLRQVLKKRRQVPHVFPIYHFSAYPTGGPDALNEVEGARIREHWSPLFEKYGVRAAFEHHFHRYKRTVPIRQERPHENGVVYLSGSPGGSTPGSPIAAEDLWYLAKVKSVRNAIVVTLEGRRSHFLAVSDSGEIIDEYVIDHE